MVLVARTSFIVTIQDCVISYYYTSSMFIVQLKVRFGNNITTSVQSSTLPYQVLTQWLKQAMQVSMRFAYSTFNTERELACAQIWLQYMAYGVYIKTFASREKSDKYGRAQ